MDFCYECAKPMVIKQGDITVNKQGYGDYIVKGVIHLECDICKTKIILPKEAKRVESEGTKIHLLSILDKEGPKTTLELKEIIKSDVIILEEVANKLIKEDIIYISPSSDGLHTVSLLKQKEDKSIVDKIKLFFNKLGGSK